MTRFFNALSILGSFVWTAAGSPALEAKECRIESGLRSVGLLELYTSEGCNSCPPADAWLNELSRHGLGANRVVALALHVDYWDYIGWKDRFAQPIFTERQRRASQRDGLGSIYTPQVTLNGVTIQRWGDTAKLGAALDLIQKIKPRADLALTLQDIRADRLGVRVSANVHDTNDKSRSAIYVALYENGLSSEVRAGENSGVTLRHNYVVRKWLGPFDAEDATGEGIAHQIDVADDWNRNNLGVAAFVEHRDTGAILQAIALPICR